MHTYVPQQNEHPHVPSFASPHCFSRRPMAPCSGLPRLFSLPHAPFSFCSHNLLHLYNRAWKLNSKSGKQWIGWLAGTGYLRQGQSSYRIMCKRLRQDAAQKGSGQVCLHAALPAAHAQQGSAQALQVAGWQVSHQQRRLCLRALLHAASCGGNAATRLGTASVSGCSPWCCTGQHWLAEGQAAPAAACYSKAQGGGRQQQAACGRLLALRCLCCLCCFSFTIYVHRFRFTVVHVCIFKLRLSSHRQVAARLCAANVWHAARLAGSVRKQREWGSRWETVAGELR